MFTESIMPRTGQEAKRSTGLIESVFQPFLAASQNPDGGWGYHPGSKSSVEATAWALMALSTCPHDAEGIREGVSEVVAQGLFGNSAVDKALGKGPHCHNADRELQEAKARGVEWLKQIQLPDGSWPAFKALREGCWVTSLACLALRAHKESTDRLAGGVKWLVNSRPAEAALWRRLHWRLVRKSSVTRQDHSLHGWSWTPGAASWVEPTSYALVLLTSIPETLYPPGTASRIRLAERMLYDRMCSGGGWNAGNPEVYSVAGIPRVGPTAWALIALRRHDAHPEHRESVLWLENHYSGIRGPGSLALAHFALASCGRCVPPIEPALREWYQANQFFRSVLVFAWASLAASRKSPWARPACGSAQ